MRYRRVSAIAASAVLFAAGCSRGPSDAAIAAQIKARFFSDPLVKVSAVSVTVDHGQVTLAGTVGSVNIELQALKLAMEAEGVRKVSDRISVAPPPEPPKMVAQSAPRLRKPQPAAVKALAKAGPESPLPSQAVPGTARGLVQAAPPLQVAVLAPRPVAVPIPAEPASGYAVPVPVPVAVPVNVTSPAAEVRQPPLPAPVILLGIGPSAPAALFRSWATGFSKSEPRARIEYQASGAASAQRTADFGVFDMPIANEELSREFDRRLLRLPAAVVGVVPICNIGGKLETLNFSGETLAAMFSGKIARWDDPALRLLNPQVFMPAAPITVVHRSDASDETWLFTEYLSAVSPAWKASVGGAPSVNWPVGSAAAGNPGVMNLVRKTPNSIGYVDASFARQSGLRWCAVQNRAGRLVKASPASLAAAAETLVTTPLRDLIPSIVDAPGQSAYPIASLLWLGVPMRLSDPNKREPMRSFLAWMLTQGQAQAAALGYGPLPTALLAKEQAQIAKVQ